MKVKILIDDGIRLYNRLDILPRWKVGEIGELLENDSKKYDHKVLLPCTVHIDDLFGRGPVDTKRIFYFYKGEVELLKEEYEEPDIYHNGGIVYRRDTSLNLVSKGK